jgi:hypothetical protein
MSKQSVAKQRATARNQKRAQQNAARTGKTLVLDKPKEPKPAPPQRRMDGLTWLATRTPPRLTQQQLMTGRWYGEVCSEAARAALPGHAGLEGSGGFGSKTLGALTLEAIGQKVAVDRILLEFLPPEFGKPMIELLEAVCFHGETLRDRANGDRYETIVLEERLKQGLAFVRHLVNHPQKKLFQVTHRVLEAAE